MTEPEDLEKVGHYTISSRTEGGWAVIVETPGHPSWPDRSTYSWIRRTTTYHESNHMFRWAAERKGRKKLREARRKLIREAIPDVVRHE